MIYFIISLLDYHRTVRINIRPAAAYLLLGKHFSIIVVMIIIRLYLLILI